MALAMTAPAPDRAPSLSVRALLAPRVGTAPHDAGLLLIRSIVGFVGVFHGAQKLFGALGGHGMEGFTGFLRSLNVPMPAVSAYLAAGSEFFGGLLLIVGLLTRFAALPFAFAMLVAAFMVHGAAFSAQNNGMEYPLTLAVTLIAVALMGPGRFSADHAVFGRRAGN